jgi:hypothetical protein
MKNKNSLKWLTPLLLCGSISLISNVQAGSTLSAGIDHVCAIQEDNTLLCWGANDNNQADPPSGTFSEIEVGLYFGCGLKTDGSLSCWGRDTAGETSPPPGKFIHVAVGGNHACALPDNRVPTCWGANSSSQSSPLPGPFQQLALGDAHSCGLKADGTVECWGLNDHEQSNVEADTFTSIAAGYRTTCGIKTDGVAICWGRTAKSYGYLTQIDFALVACHRCSWTAEYLFCGLKADNTLSCPPITSAPSGVFSYVTTGGHDGGSSGFQGFACGIRENGLVACWGANRYDRATPPVGVKVKHIITPPPPPPPGGCTKADLDKARKEAQNACQANPASCGITTGSACPVDNTCPVCPVVETSTEIEQVREEGKEEGIATCRTNPASCGIVNIPNLETSSGTYLSFNPKKDDEQIDVIGGAVFYNVGDKIGIDLAENFQQANRFKNVDLWVIIEMPNRDLIYKTPTVVGGFSFNPQAFREALNSTQTTHRILEIEVIEGLGGDYSFSAVYVAEGKNPMVDGFFVQRSNVARLKAVLSNTAN